jgi:probable rRNA maturation factor
MTLFINPPKINWTTKGKAWSERAALIPQLEQVLVFTNEIVACPGFLSLLNQRDVSLTLVFAHDSFIQKINKKWRGKDHPTNVLSFPEYDAESSVELQLLEPEVPVSLGDIILSYETCVKEAFEKGIPFQNHVCHLFLHGILHLLGYDHIASKEAEIMESLETRILGSLSIPNPYARVFLEQEQESEEVF